MYNSNYQDEQKIAQAKILAAYSPDSIKKATNLVKSESNDIQKGGKGEGSRGGKIIGHTKSGKPIYDVDASKTNNVSGKEGYHSDFQDNHKHFTSEDHKDAHEAHLKEHGKHGEAYTKHYNSVSTDEWNQDDNEKGKAARKGTRESADEQTKHGKLADWHKEAAEKKEDEEKYGQSLGITSSGKHIHKNKEAANYKDFSSKDHKEAADVHKKHEKEDTNHGIEKRYQHLHRSGKSDEEKEALFDAYIKEHKSKKEKKTALSKADFDMDIIKGGEGSKGGKVIGHTQSGKAIYDTHDHKNHKDFSKHDHKEAADEHEIKAKHHDLQWQHHNSKSLSEKQISARKGEIKKSEEIDLEKGVDSQKISPVVPIGTISPNGKFIKSETGWDKNTIEKSETSVIEKSNTGVAIGTVSPNGKFVKSETGWSKKLEN